MVFVWIGAAASALVFNVVQDLFFSDNDVDTEVAGDKKRKDSPPIEKKSPVEGKSSAGCTVADLLERYSHERSLFESSLPTHYMVKGDIVFELDILEAFIMHSTEEGSLKVLKSLILLLVASNCSKCLNKEFPADALSYIFDEAITQLLYEIDQAAYTFEFKKVALKAAKRVQRVVVVEYDRILKPAV